MTLKCAIGMIAIAWLLLGCTGTSTSGTSPSPATTYTDPFTYCTTVGTIDRPDTRYTGNAVPSVIAEHVRQAIALAHDTPQDLLLNGTLWRCMDGKVYACFVGAAIPCRAKANTDRTPTNAMTTFCTQNATNALIPVGVTGRETIYTWHCNQKAATPGEAFTEADAQGFLASAWHLLGSDLSAKQEVPFPSPYPVSP